MSDNSDHIAIVFPVTSAVPTDFNIQEGVEAHCTLIYLGKVSEATFTKEDVQSVLDRMQISAPGEVSTLSLELFGPEQDALVITLDDTRLVDIRNSIEKSLSEVGSGNASEYADYRPHVTLDAKTDLTLDMAMESIEIPMTVTLDSPELWWGDE